MGGLLDCHLEQSSGLRRHRRRTQFLPVHFSEPLQSLEFLLVIRVLGEESLLGQIVLEIDLGFADFRRIQRWLSDVDEAGLDQWSHLPEEERQEQGTDVAAVDIGIRKDDDLVIASLVRVELVADAAADRSDECRHLGVLQHLVQPSTFDVQDLAANRKNRLCARVARVESGSAS